MLERIARTCYRRRWLVLVVWIITLVGLSVLSKTSGGEFANDFRLPATESRRAFDLLDQRFPARAGLTGDIVFVADAGVNDPAVKDRMTKMFTAAASVTGVRQVVSPYSQAGARQVSPDGKIAFAELHMADFHQGQGGATRDAMNQLRAQAETPGLRIELAGAIFQNNFQVPATEGFGILAAIVILLIAFGSLLAMGLPILTALFGIGCGVAIVQILTRLMDVPDFTTQVASMIGIGVGIDYALFIVTRYRSFLAEGFEPEAAVARALNTAGRAVMFAGITVVISLLGMFLMGVNFVRGLAVGASFAVLMTMLASLTLLPAILGFTGRNIDKLGLPHRKKADGVEREALWHRWSRVIQRRPWPPFLVGLAVLVTLGLPVFALRLGSADAGNLPTNDTTRQAYDLLATGFGPGFNGPFVVVSELPKGAADMGTVTNLADQLRKVPGVAFASQPQPSPQNDAAVIQLYPTSSPQAKATTTLLHHLRNDVVPSVVHGTGVTTYIGGQTAAFEDFAGVLSSRLPLFMGVVLLLSFLLLMAVFRSIIVPVKAVVMNLLSIGASYGVIVAMFEWGWGKNLIGIGKEGPIEAWAPMMLFAIVFGLSMDYEVFLLSRIREEYDRTGDNGIAVADGLASTARVITAAAAIMVCVFASFVFGDLRQIKLVGLGLAIAVLIDATLVRMVLVPSTMELLGKVNWWFPKWLDRLVPQLHVDGEALERELQELAGSEKPETVS